MKLTYLQKTLQFILITLLLNSCDTDHIKEKDENQITENQHFLFETNSNKGELVTIKHFNENVQVEKIKDQYVFEGDIILTPDQEMEYTGDLSAKSTSVGRTTARWENNIVYYTIDENLNYQYRVYDAMAHWEAHTEIRFAERTDNISDYVTFTTGTGCSSYVGRVGGRQYIWLADACSTGNTIHEIGHAIGLWHEQSRKDRDDYITINFENIEAGYEHNFQTYEERWRDGFEYTEYFDFESIMMYPPYAFSTNGLPTITTLSGNTNYGYQRNELSEGDIEGVYKMYPQITPTIGIGEINNPSFSINSTYKTNSTSTCSCFGWYNPSFPKQPGSSTDSNDFAGTEGGGSIKLNYEDAQSQRVAYQLINVYPNVAYKLSFYYAITNTTNLGELDFRVLGPEAIDPSTVTDTNTIIQFTGGATENTSSIDASKGGGQLVELEFTPNSDQIVLYATNSVLQGSDVRIDNFNLETALPQIKNATFSLNRTYKDNSTSTCSCFEWYNPNFSKQPASSTDSNDFAGTEGGGSIKLTYEDSANQRTAYQLINGITPNTTYKLTFYYSITNGTNSGKLDFRVLSPSAVDPLTVNNTNTIAQFTGEQTNNSWSIDASKGGGQLAELEFTSTANEIVLYAVNSVLEGTDVRIDNFAIEIVE